MSKIHYNQDDLIDLTVQIYELNKGQEKRFSLIDSTKKPVYLFRQAVVMANSVVQDNKEQAYYKSKIIKDNNKTPIAIIVKCI